MMKSLFFAAAVLVAGALSSAHAADVTLSSKVDYVWINGKSGENPNGVFAFKLVGSNIAFDVNSSSAAGSKILSMLLTAKTSDVMVHVTYDNVGNVFKFIRFN